MRLPLRKSERVSSLVVLAITMAALVYGCGEDSENPQSSTPPSLSISLGCADGAPELQVTNNGGPMTQQKLCTLSYEDGALDSLFILLDEGQGVTCRLSNLHGGVTAGIEATSISESSEDCLAPAFQEMLQTFADTLDLAGMMPTNLPDITIVFCQYSCRLENITHGSPAVSVLRVPGGMELQVVYPDISGDIIADTSDPLCADFTGTLSIASVAYSADVMFATQPDHSVSFELANVAVTINDLDIQIDGVLGFLVNWLIAYIADDFVMDLEQEFANEFLVTLEPLLSAIAVAEAGCE